MKVVNQECIKGFVEGRHMEGKTIVLHGWAENRSGNNKIIIRNCEKCINRGGD